MENECLNSPVISVLEVQEGNLPCHKMLMIFRYWQELKGEAGLPQWREFAPDRVAKALPSILLYDALVDGGYFVSVVGQVLSSKLELSAEPKSLRDFMPAANYADVKSRLDMVRDREEPHLVRKDLSWRRGTEEAARGERYTVLFLPFRHQVRDVSHKIVNILHFDGDPNS